VETRDGRRGKAEWGSCILKGPMGEGVHRRSQAAEGKGEVRGGEGAGGVKEVEEEEEGRNS